MTTTLIESTSAEPRINHATLIDAFATTVAAHPDLVALRSPGGAQTLTWAQYAERAERIAAGLAQLGVQRGDVIAMLLTQRLEALLVDTAALQLGVVTVSLYPGDSLANARHILDDCGASVLVTEAALADRATAARGDIEHLVTVDAGPAGALTLADLERDGDPAFDLAEARAAIEPDDIVSILYTSGTTGPPKGVVYTHATVMAGVASWDSGSPALEELRYVSFLPLAHLGERGLGYWRALYRGATITFCPDPAGLEEALAEARPTWMFAPPRIWDRLKAGIESAGVSDPAVARAHAGLDALENGVTGAAACPDAVHDFFRRIGVPLQELWGMTEAWIGTMTRPGEGDEGTVGRAMPGFELSLADDGELLVRGDALTPGYLNRPDVSAELVTAEGWLRTGDLATIDEAGRVRIVDRKKEMIINSAGHNMAPTNIENRLKSASPLIAQACCIGDGRDYVVALITLNEAAAREAATGSGASLAQDAGVLAAIDAAVTRANARMDERERVVRHAVVPDQWVAGAELTPTMKLRRREIDERYAGLIEELYMR